MGNNNGAGVVGSSNSANAPFILGKYAAYFDGNIAMTTDYAYKTTTNTWFVSSDKRLKKDIVSFTDGLNVIRKINPVTYKYTGAGGLPKTDTNIGVLAQDVQPFVPYCIGTTKMVMKQSEASAFASDVVSTFQDSSGIAMEVVNTLTMNTHGLFYVMLNSIKQLDSTVTGLQKQITQLQSDLSYCRKTNDKSNLKTTNQNSADNNNNNAILYQNTPNPFSRETQIKCFIPDKAIASDIYIYDMQGTQLNKIQISGKGDQTIAIQGAELKAGMYMYTLIIDGKEIDTKKMILTK